MKKVLLNEIHVLLKLLNEISVNIYEIILGYIEWILWISLIKMKINKTVLENSGKLF